MLEEPLVRQTFETGKPLTGRRDWELGQTDIMMFTYAIHDGNTPMAVVTLKQLRRLCTLRAAATF
jgi:hypothetical protein